MPAKTDEVRSGPDNDLKANVVELDDRAAAATDLEHQLTLWKSLKLYPKATGWSILLSTAVIMEGFDQILLNNLFAMSVFNRRFGYEYAPGEWQVSAAWQSALSNGNLVGIMLGLTINGWVVERFGYRRTIIYSLFSVIFFVFLTFFIHSLPQLLAGEILLGIPWGVFQTITTTYASEVCPIQLRAYLTTYVNLCWVIGQLIASGALKGITSTMANDQWTYRIPMALQWVWPIPLMIGVFLAPESPWWLVRKDRIDEAKHSLLRLTKTNNGIPFNADETIAMMVRTTQMEKDFSPGTSYLDLFRGKVNLRRTELTCGVWLIQATCGASFMGYSTYFYESAGLSNSNSFTMSLIQYGLGAVGTLTSWFLMLRFGRRTLYLYGQVGMAVTMLIIGLLTLAEKTNVSAQWAIGSMLLLFTFIYDATIGPVCYSLVTEMPPTRLKNKMVVMACNVYQIGGIICNIITPRMLNPSAWNWGSWSGLFWAGACFLSAIWTFFRLPEPKGRSYAELDALFERGIPARKFSSTVIDGVSGSVSDMNDELKQEAGAGFQHHEII